MALGEKVVGFSVPTAHPMWWQLSVTAYVYYQSVVTKRGSYTGFPQQRLGGAGTPGRQADHFPQDN